MTNQELIDLLVKEQADFFKFGANKTIGELLLQQENESLLLGGISSDTDFITTFQPVIDKLNDKCLEEVIHSASITISIEDERNIYGNDFHVSASIHHLKRQIAAANASATTNQRRLLLTALLQANLLKLQPDNIEACRALLKVQSQLNQFNIFHKIVAAITSLLKCIPLESVQRYVASKQARANLPTAIHGFLHSPNKEVLYQGQQHRFPMGSNACSAVSLNTASVLASLSDTKLTGVEDPTPNLNSAAAGGVALNSYIATSIVNRFSQKSIAEVEESIVEVLDEESDLRQMCAKKITEEKVELALLPSLNTAALDLRNKTQEQRAQEKSLDKILSDAEAKSSNVVFVATSQHMAKNKGHTISFISRQTELGERVYGIADSKHSFLSGKYRQGSFKMFNDKASFERSLLSTFCVKEERDMVVINAYDAKGLKR